MDEDYWVARIYGSKAIGSGFKIFGRVENLFDKEYEEVWLPSKRYGGIQLLSKANLLPTLGANSV